VLADDDVLLREGLASLLDRSGFDAAILLSHAVEPADGGAGEGADGSDL
jgi:hypothetical protein